MRNYRPPKRNWKFVEIDIMVFFCTLEYIDNATYRRDILNATTKKNS